MWSIEETIVIDAPAEIVWELWTDVEHWNVWDHGIAWSRIEGAFEKGAHGVLKPKSGPKSKFTLVEVQKGKRFKDISRLPLCTIEFDHQLTPEQGRVRVTHSISLVGPLSFLFTRILGKQFSHDLAAAVKTLASLAEQRHSQHAAIQEPVLT